MIYVGADRPCVILSSPEQSEGVSKDDVSSPQKVAFYNDGFIETSKATERINYLDYGYISPYVLNVSIIFHRSLRHILDKAT